MKKVSFLYGFEENERRKKNNVMPIIADFRLNSNGK